MSNPTSNDRILLTKLHAMLTKFEIHDVLAEYAGSDPEAAEDLETMNAVAAALSGEARHSKTNLLNNPIVAHFEMLANGWGKTRWGDGVGCTALDGCPELTCGDVYRFVEGIQALRSLDYAHNKILTKTRPDDSRFKFFTELCEHGAYKDLCPECSSIR